MWDDEEKPGLQDDLIRRIALFEEGTDGKVPEWLGGPSGILVGVGLLVLAGGIGALGAVAAFATDSPFVAKVGLAGFLLVLMAAAAFWRRQRLAAHFEGAKRLVDSTHPTSGSAA